MLFSLASGEFCVLITGEFNLPSDMSGYVDLRPILLISLVILVVKLKSLSIVGYV